MVVGFYDACMRVRFGCYRLLSDDQIIIMKMICVNGGKGTNNKMREWESA